LFKTNKARFKLECENKSALQRKSTEKNIFWFRNMPKL
jgi:hypothetical protein